LSYSHTTRAQLRSLLATRLGDPADVHWLVAEKDMLIADVLSRWALLTGSSRGRGTFPTANATALYDIDASAALSTLIGHSRTDRDEIGLMQFMLREPYDPIDGTGMSDQFTFATLVSSLERARNQLLADTFVELSLDTLTVDLSAGPATLPDSTIAVRRAVWKTLDLAYSNLHLTDEYEVLAYDTMYPLTPGIPELYSPLGSAALVVRLYPPPDAIGTMEMIVVRTGAALNPATPVVLGIPDDTTWVARSQALADLLGRDGPAYDPTRAAFMRSEYEFGAALIAQSPTILNVEIQGAPVVPSSLADIDFAYSSPHWQNTAGVPRDLGTIGGNIVALRPVPNGIYPVTLDVVAKAVQPTADDDFVQIGREDVAAILDGCESLALFKLGGTSIDDSTRLMQQMISAAMRYNSRLSALGYGESMSRTSSLDAASRPEGGGDKAVGTVSARQKQQQQQERR
jgi:hypothetical protein